MGPGDKNVVFSVWQEINFNRVYLDGRYANMYVCSSVRPLPVTAGSRWQRNAAANSDIPCTALYKGRIEQPRAKCAPVSCSATTLSMSDVQGTNERTRHRGAQCVATDSDCGVLHLTLTAICAEDSQPSFACD